MAHHGAMKRAIKALAVVTTAGMLLVLVAGATVTNTGSEHGCGKSWPLCQGKFIPQFAFTTAIEYVHRIDAGLETILILTLSAGAWYLYGHRREIRILAPLMVSFLFLQAGLGAWAVMEPQASAVLALHFGVSLVAFASVLLTTLFLFNVDGSDSLRDIRPPVRFRRYVWALSAFTYVVVYSGAYVRHSDADEACSGWPLCNNRVIPVLHDKVASNFGHRLLAATLTLAIALLVLWAFRLRRSRPDLFSAAVAVLVLLGLQIIAGAAVAWTRVDVFAAVAHAGIIGLMFGALCTLCLRVLPRPAIREQAHKVTAMSPAADAAPVGR
jgi:cytochrome c oxidase assembly protein subunit 15